jgi:hypothetical protein
MSGSFHHRSMDTFHSSTNDAIILAFDSVTEQNTTLSPLQPHIIHKTIPIKGFSPEFNNVWRQAP